MADGRSAWDRWLVGSHRECDKPALTAEQIKQLEVMRRRVASGELSELGLEQLRPWFIRWLYVHGRVNEGPDDPCMLLLTPPGVQ